ncbi:Endo-1,4-beta-xylanase B [Lachnellula suecica]|uniref:Endo-1,4-beta-xylanase n=1 Tax=Lachnellula suecica TaxID=602035 RepID=A0A8T9CB92_9HELO|nr:Endo-1,4-beta-xylanase B [Lachnellula suecica]
MATFTKLAVAFLAAAGSLAAPLEVLDVVERNVTERGEPDFTLGAHNFRKRQSPNYSQDYIASGANVQFTPNGASFGVTFNTQSDFVVGRGWTTGDSTPITMSGTASFTSGVGLLSVYGWSTSPLVEYYIIEDALNPPQQGTIKGTFTSDGGTYTVWEHQQVNQPSIQGTSTFNQYLSIRTSGRSTGTVTLANHFKQWASYGMSLGSMNYQTVSVESWSGAGKVQMTVGKSAAGGGTGTTPPASTSVSGTQPTTPATGGSCAAMYGQCGGTGFTGSTCCSSGTCKAANSYYSQCL